MNLQSDKEWWTQQWIDLLNSYRFKKRLERARNYARQGNVLSLKFKEQRIIAQVQGTAPEPYKLSLWLDTFSDEDWNYIIQTLSERAIFTAKLLAGEMPQNIEEVFAANGLRLFPFTLEEIHSRCDCPDKARVCKHIAAVYYLLGDRFSDDPFLLFQLRGRTQEKILAELRQKRGQSEYEKATETEQIKSEKTQEQQSVTNSIYATSVIPENIKLEQIWEYNQQLDSSLIVITPSPSNETILDVLGKISLGASTDIVMDYFQKIYQNISQQAVITALKQGEDEGDNA
ncbi:SWIM zinc finger family protein [Okeania sp.]|uniref:SWIM zinc finger family protein n=1 Tax=Okeania sp. TaxID=3100323 RepID=UPI002B4B821A|nr:SWIM zinc finger family protein [Okeania sp.]MEB3339237.1 SWIM zinc finger family protein [Okeania sp.]